MLALREDIKPLSSVWQASAMTVALASVAKFKLKKSINKEGYTYNSLRWCFFQRAKS